MNITLLLSTPTRTVMQCATLCNELCSCRSFNFDSSSQQCQLYEADLSTGSIVSSSSLSSMVGTVRILPSHYAASHDQACAACVHNRYEICSTNTNTCQCPNHTYWNGEICALQLFHNDACPQADACRSDVNLTCSVNCYDEFERCIVKTTATNSSNAVGYGVTVAGNCNGSSNQTQTALNWPSDVLLLPNGTLYVGNYDGRLLAYEANNRISRTIRTFNSWPTFMYFDNRTLEFYVSVVDAHLVYLLASSRTIPPDGSPTGICSTSRLNRPKVVITDSSGNAYISSNACHWVMKWSPNASNDTVVAGSTTGTAGTSAASLSSPYGLALDEANSFLYVADSGNNRIQRFLLNGTTSAVTVAGGSGAGAAPNQLRGPVEILRSKWDGSLYIADRYNHRVQKWLMNASSGVTVAGSTNGTSGVTSYLMNEAYAISLNENETYLYVTDTNNYRIQRFSLK